MLIYEKSRPGRQARAQTPGKQDDKLLLAGLKDHLRREAVGRPKCLNSTSSDTTRTYRLKFRYRQAVLSPWFLHHEIQPRGAHRAASIPGFWLVILLRQNRLARDIWLAFTNCNKSWPK